MTETEIVIEEIREGRRRISEQCEHDPAKLIEYLKTLNETYAAQVERYRKGHPTSSSASR